MNSAVVAAGDAATAAQYNNVRKDLVLSGADFATSGGAANVQTLALDSQIVTSYVTGTRVKFKAGFTNTASATINVNGIAANTIKRRSGALLAPSDIFLGEIVELVYDGTNFILVTGRRDLLEGTSGEALSVGDAVYVKASDGKLYKTDADADESTYSFAGINQSAASGADVAVVFAPPGSLALGLSSLTAGSYYFVDSAAGAIAATPNSTRYAKIGQALTTTTLRVCEPRFIRRGSFSLSASGDTTVTTGFLPGRISFMFAKTVQTATGMGSGDAGNVGYSLDGDASVCGVSAGQITGGSWTNLLISNAAILGRSNGTNDYHLATITAKSASGFTVTNTKTNSPDNLTVYWCAESL